MTASKVTSYKGFSADLTCRGFQFAVGQSYAHEGDVKACESGFHACEYPLDCFNYYAPGGSAFAVVEQSGELSRHDEDSKIASSELRVVAKIDIAGLVKAAFDYTWSRAKLIDGSHTTGYQGAASATGDQGAASATGYRGAASATGNRGAASATGYQGAASATGDQGAAMGADGNALFLVEREAYTGRILHAWAGVVGRDGIKPLTWYTLRDGKPVVR
jgi:hypothetical protein